MHPRERVLGIAYLYHEKGEEIPKHVLKEAEQLGIDVSEYQTITTKNKETAHGRKKTTICDT
jgi:hypothetical protein